MPDLSEAAVLTPQLRMNRPLLLPGNECDHTPAPQRREDRLTLPLTVTGGTERPPHRVIGDHRSRQSHLGDDVGDLPAFAHIGELVTAARLDVGAAVLITSDETVPELREVATDLVDGPDAAVAVLDAILDVARRA